MRCRYQQNERKYDGVLQRGWYRGFIFNADFPVPDSAVAVLGLFYFTDKESSRLTSLVLFFFMGDTVSGDLPPERRQGAAPVLKRAKYYTRGRIIMEFMTGKTEKKTVLISDILSGEYEGKEVLLNGAVHKIRDMGEVAFVVLRTREGLVQTVYEEGTTTPELKELCEEAAVTVKGTVALEERAPQGFEIRAVSFEILSKPVEPMPIAINKWKMNTSLETKLDLRPLSLRNVKERAKFRVQEGIVRGFRDYLHSQGFTEIHSPKIGARGAEGGANLFRLEYFHKHAVLAQSPQFYKQMMVGVFDRVFEAAPVFRAEKHNTKRHLNEYTSLDFEMGYIDSFEDIMEMETGFLQYTMKLLETEYAKELKMLGVTLPKVDEIPQVRFDKAKELVAEKYNRKIRNPFDLEPEEESLIGQYFQRRNGCRFCLCNPLSIQEKTILRHG